MSATQSFSLDEVVVEALRGTIDVLERHPLSFCQGHNLSAFHLAQVEIAGAIDKARAVLKKVEG